MSILVTVMISHIDEETNEAYDTSSVDSVVGDTWMEVVDVFERSLHGAGFQPQVNGRFLKTLQRGD